MRRVLLCCAASLALYWMAFAYLLDRPLSLGFLRLEMQQKLARGAQLTSPKLVILAGSNGPYSHSCAVIGTMLRIPCENAGVAVGIGLDDLFYRWAQRLRRGDIVYLPMEIQQYTITRAENRMSVDGAMLFRHDPRLLWRLGLSRALGGAFANTLPDALESVTEMAARGAGSGNPRVLLAAQYNEDGDRIGTSAATADPAFLASLHRAEPSAQKIYHGYGTRMIARFVTDETAQGVIVIGGLPTDFRDVSLPDSTIEALRSVYTGHGGQFMELANRSRYPRRDFYDSEDHLMQPCQYMHSILIGRALADLLKRRAMPPSPAAHALAEACPSAMLEARLMGYTTSGARWLAARAQASPASSANSSDSFFIIVPPSSSASTMVTARR